MPAHLHHRPRDLRRTARSLREAPGGGGIGASARPTSPARGPRHRVADVAEPTHHLSRRSALTAAAVATGGWTLSTTLSPAEAARLFPGNPAPQLPGGLTPYLEVFVNWSQEIRTSPVWTVAPSNAQQVVDLARWAAANQWKLRAKGYQHNWSPLSVASGSDRNTTALLVDTGRLNAVSVDTSDNTVTAQAGASLESVLTAANSRGLGVMHHPAPGEVTLGGVLAIGGHGAALPGLGETRPAGASYGSLSNLVVSLEAVVWDDAAGDYALRRFERTDPDIGPLLTSLGRTFITSAQLRVAPVSPMRCRSYTGIPASELLSPWTPFNRTFSSFLNAHGRVEIIHFPFTTHAWLKTWQISPFKPSSSKRVTAPYNYYFADNLPRVVTHLIRRIQTGLPALVRELGPLQQQLSAAGLSSSGSRDLWGAPKDLMLYVRPSTMRVTASGYAIHCRRSDVQRVVSEFYQFYTSQLRAYELRGRYPVNGPLEIRASGVDDPNDVEIPGAVAPALSASRPFEDHPEWDTVVWLDILTFPGTPHSAQFYQECEQWIIDNYASYAGTRVEWSKGWGYSASGPWSNQNTVGTLVPQSFGAAWDTAVQTLERLDPARIYSAPLHDALMPQRNP